MHEFNFISVSQHYLFLFVTKNVNISCFSEFEDAKDGTTPPSSTSVKTSSSIGVPAAGPAANLANPVPMPTLYNGANDLSSASSSGQAPGASRGQKETPSIQVLLYNMASMLAGVAVGYDVRLSNVSPIHPNLYPNRYVFSNQIYPRYYLLFLITGERVKIPGFCTGIHAVRMDLLCILTTLTTEPASATTITNERHLLKLISDLFDSLMRPSTMVGEVLSIQPQTRPRKTMFSKMSTYRTK